MSEPRSADSSGAARRVRRLSVFLLIALAQFGLFEAALRTWGSSEAAPSFQGLFEGDPVLGYRLMPNARTHFRTSEFAADIAINSAGVRDDDEIGPKAPNEKRIVVLGDSLVLSVQVPFDRTFGELLERRLNGSAASERYRVINAGVQGYGPIEEQIFLQRIVPTVQPDLVLVALFVGNDAEEAWSSRRKLNTQYGEPAPATETLVTRLRRLVRRSMVLQILRLRILAAAERFTPALTPPEPPLQSYAARPAPRIEEGLAIARSSIEEIMATSSAAGATTAVMLMPARFQVDDADYGRLRDTVSKAGGELVRDAATDRFARILAPLQIPVLDVLPELRANLPGPDLFFQETVHLTPRGHEIVAEALTRFIAAHQRELRLVPR
jgi:lysophospholipase L1-like esterase